MMKPRMNWKFLLSYDGKTDKPYFMVIRINPALWRDFLYDANELNKLVSFGNNAKQGVYCLALREQVHI